MKHSKLSIATIVLGFVFFPAAIITGLIDIMKGNKEEKHILTYVGLGIAALMLIVGVANYKPSSQESSKEISQNQNAVQDTVQQAVQEEAKEVPSVENNENKEPEKADISETETPQEVKQEIPNMTVSQEQALKSAKQYLGYSAFSHDGLIDQLEFEKFSTEDATFAADNCGADWKEQAAKKAKDYLDVMSFSRGSLIDQLKYDGFTDEEAEYGVTEAGL